jgi:hypothetical protein
MRERRTYLDPAYSCHQPCRLERIGVLHARHLGLDEMPISPRARTLPIVGRSEKNRRTS